MTGNSCSIFFFEIMKNITNTHAITTYFVGVGWADAFTGSTNFRIAFCRFVCSIQQAVCR